MKRLKIRHINISKKDKIIFIGAAAVVMLAIVITLLFGIKSISHKGITVAEAAKLIACADADMTTLEMTDSQLYWYEPYMQYINENGYFEGEKPKSKVKYKDVYAMAEKLGAVNAVADLSINKSGNITKQEFLEVYLRLLDYFTYGNEVQVIIAGVVGTPANMAGSADGEAHTTQGVFKFTGLVMDDKIDNTVKLIVRDDEILSVAEVVDTSVTYRNIWVKSSDETSVYANVYGVDRTFSVTGLEEPVSEVLSDIEIADGKVKKVDIKTDTISGKVQSVSDEYVEIEGYGKVLLDDYFMIYDISKAFSIKSYKDIVVGYSLQDFVVADGKICGAVISKKLEAENIRVLIKTTSFADIFHEKVDITSDSAFVVKYGEVTNEYAAGQVVSFKKGDECFNQGRVMIVPKEEGKGQIQILNVKRSQGNPSYEGKVEISQFEPGFVIVNDLNIESYLKRVVPSEMPVRFGVEALKVQAVCARSYAYKQLTNNHYGVYGAHVDDSIQYQVYNNTIEYEASNEAIKLTSGKVLQYNGEIVQAYYYSTSCGSGTDVSVWGSNAANYPYFTNKIIGTQDNGLNLQSEEDFEKFITSKNENDYDYEFELYRWRVTQTPEQLSECFNARLHEKYTAQPKKILTKNAAGEFVSQEITTVGTITNITVETRTAGGAVYCAIVEGTEATVKIVGESYIRAMFGNENVTMTTNNSTRNMASLPSAFCIFKKNYDGDKLVSFDIIGGGYGHGIGMSQNAVSKMTASGMSYVPILQFFYPGTVVDLIDNN